LEEQDPEERLENSEKKEARGVAQHCGQEAEQRAGPVRPVIR
jgi:hypothetical protein